MPKSHKMKRAARSSVNKKASSKKRVAPVNAIFKLNDDCLAEIFRYLEQYEVQRLIKVDQRFRSSALKRLSGGGLKQIDKNLLYNIPLDTYQDFYKNYGERVVCMEFVSLEESDFSKVLSYFPNINAMVLNRMKISKFHALPTTLTSLKLDDSKIPGSVLQKWFAQVSGTLTELKLVDSTEAGKGNPKKYESLKKLTKLTSLSLEGAFPEETVGKLITRNKLTLQTLDLSPCFQEYLPETVWNVVSQLNQSRQQDHLMIRYRLLRRHQRTTNLSTPNNSAALESSGITVCAESRPKFLHPFLERLIKDETLLQCNWTGKGGMKKIEDSLVFNAISAKFFETKAKFQTAIIDRITTLRKRITNKKSVMRRRAQRPSSP